MDAAQVLAKVEQARSFEHAIGAMTFRCRVPSEGRVALIYSRFEGPSRFVEAMAAVLAETVIGVAGATTVDLRLEGEAEPLPDSAETARLLLDERQDLASELAGEIDRRMQARKKALDDDRKN